MDSNTFSNQFCKMSLEQQLELLQTGSSSVSLETILSAVFDLSVHQQQLIFAQIPFEVQKSWVGVLSIEQKQILLQRATTVSEPDEIEESQHQPVETKILESSLLYSSLSVPREDEICASGKLEVSETFEKQSFVTTVATIMRTYGPLRSNSDLLPLATIILDHIFLWLQRLVESLPEQKNTFKYFSTLYPLSLGPFLRWKEMNNARKAKVAKVPTIERLDVEEVWIPELSIFLGQKHRLLEQNRLTATMSYSDYTVYCRDREESFLRSRGKQRQKVFRSTLVKLCPAAEKILNPDVVQLLAYLAKDRVGLITEVMIASAAVSPAGVSSAIHILTRLFPEPAVMTLQKKRRKDSCSGGVKKRKDSVT